MNWEIVGSLAELLGALAVIATLVFLIKQIRENTASNRLSTAWEMMSSFNSVHAEIFSNSEVAALVGKIWSGDELDELDSIRLANMVTAQVNTLTVAHEAFHSEQLPDAMWKRLISESQYLKQGVFAPFLLSSLSNVSKEVVVEMFGTETYTKVQEAKQRDT